MGDCVSGLRFVGADTDMMMIGPVHEPVLGLGLSVR